MSQIETEILELINAHRRSLGLAFLQLDNFAQSLAQAHTLQMSKTLVPIGHEGFEQRAEQLIRVLKGSTASENVAYGQETAEDVVKSWLASIGHRQNIEGNYTHTGIAVQKDGQDRLVFTQLFVLVEPDTSVAEAQSDNTEMCLDILHLLNEHRLKLNLPKLLIHAQVQQPALVHSQNIASKKIPLGYSGLKEKIGILVKDLGATAVAANLAQSPPNPERIVDTWLASEAHRKNVEADYTHTGIGIANNPEGEYFITQILVRIP